MMKEDLEVVEEATGVVELDASIRFRLRLLYYSYYLVATVRPK